VDFAYAFKYPAGWSYAYMDSSHELAKSSKELTASTSSISETLAQLHNSDYSYVLWNDQPAPKGSSSSPTAHAKGALIFTGAGGLWLTHSLPHFPNPPPRSSLWSSASDDFGQSFLCITLTAEEIHKLSAVMEINRPVVYDNMFADGDTKAYAGVMDWAVNKKHDDSHMTTEVTITSKGGQTFHVFGKSGNWGVGKDLYHDLVAPKMGALDMEGWRRGAGVWGPACKGSAEVLDITEVSFPGQNWETTNDHSKWAVTKSGTAFCVGDINRADGQDKRGGGTVCIQDSSFASQMRNVISTTDKCS
jgi:deoxyribonuclease-2